MYVKPAANSGQRVKRLSPNRGNGDQNPGISDSFVPSGEQRQITNFGGNQSWKAVCYQPQASGRRE